MALVRTATVIVPYNPDMSFSPEHEVRVVDFDFQELFSAILTLEGVLLSSGYQLRHLFDVPADPNGGSWLRLRSSGEGNTLTLKRIVEGQTEEIETTVGDQEKMLAILSSLGFSPRAVHETHRTIFQLPEQVILSFDRWPQLPRFVEVEGPSTLLVWEAIAALGLTKGTTSLNIPELYAQKGLTNITHRDLRFTEQEMREIAEWANQYLST